MGQQLAAHDIHGQLPQLSASDAERLSRAVETLRATFLPSHVYVFGSQARGNATHDSDVDLLVVVPESNEPTYRLAQRAYAALGSHGLPLEIVFMTRDEFAWRARAAASLPAAVLREGRLLYAA